MKELNLWGIYISPFAGELAATVLIFLPLRRWFDVIEVQRWVWHRNLFDTAIFVIILCTIGLCF